MAEPVVQDDPNQPQVAKDLLSSIDIHPGLQSVTGPDGLPVPDDAAQATSATAFLESSGQPALPATPAPPEAQTAPPAPAQAPASTGGRLLAGKYRNVEELERAQIEAQRTIRERETELRTIRAVNQHLDEVLTPFREARKEPKQNIPVSFDQQNQPYIDPNTVMEMVEERAKEIAREQVQESLRPLSALSQANARLRQEFPEVAQREGEFAQWLQANPAYQERITKDPDFYLEGAYLKFERDRGQVVNAQNLQTASAAQEQMSRARANASPAGGNPVATRRTTEEEAVVGRLNALYKAWQETGDPQLKRAYANARTELALGNYAAVLERATWGR